MPVGYFDCFAGAAGDMLLGALVDAGLDFGVLEDTVGRLALPDVRVSAERVRRGGLSGTQVRVEVGPGAQTKHRHLPDIEALIGKAELPSAVRQDALRVFKRLAEAEAQVHGIGVDQVHFHEVGAADAVVDIVGTCAGVHALQLESIVCSPVPVGSGTVNCAHGVLPVPAPATAALLRGVPLAPSEEQAELVTPTGAALLTTLATRFGPLPPLRISQIGYGAGTRENRATPNLLRLIVGTPADESAWAADTAVVLETQVDDATGQAVAHAMERLLSAGALDAFIVPIIMKKGRPGQLLTVLCRPTDVRVLEDVLFAETTTFGIRRHTCQRHKLDRTEEVVETPFGTIRVQVGRRHDETVRVWPEYADCAGAAEAWGVSLRDVQDAALIAWNQCKQRDG